jgi:hypothetical protein
MATIQESAGVSLRLDSLALRSHGGRAEQRGLLRYEQSKT